ncbi:MAG: hypothetical protein ACFCUT_02375 [Kiloniellaceae bacterium]
MAEKAKTLLRKMRFLEWASTLDLPALQMRLAVMLVSLYSERRGAAWPSLAQIVTAMGASKQGILNALKGLEARGLFSITRSRGRGHANEYVPRFDRVPEGNIYDLEKVNSSSPFNGTAATSEKVNSQTEKVNSGGLKGQPQLTPSEEVLNRGRINRSLAKAPTDVGAVDSETISQAHGFIRETEQRIGQGCLQSMHFADLESLAESLRTAATYFVEPLNGVIGETPDEHRWMQCERLLGEVMAEIEDRDVPPQF